MKLSAMNALLYQCIIISFISGNLFAQQLFKERFNWSPVEYDIQSLSPEQQKAVVQNGDTLPPNHTLVLGMQFWKNDEKLFLSTIEDKPHMSEGSLSLMLGQVDLKTTNPDNKSPPITPYAVDELMNQAKASSPPLIDECDRLWFVDYLQMRLFVINLNDGKKIRQVNLHAMPALIGGSISVDVPVNSASGQKECDNTHAYIGHPTNFEFVVYRFKDNSQWNVNEPTFTFSNLNDTLIDLLNQTIEFAAGRFAFMATALSGDDGTGNRILYATNTLMPVAFTISTQTLKNPPAKPEIKIIGAMINPDEYTSYMSPTLYYHKKTGILFYSFLNQKAVRCWNTKRFPNVVLPETTTDYISVAGDISFKDVYSMSIDAHDNLWINEMKQIKGVTEDRENRAYSSRMFSAPITELVKNTKCQPLNTNFQRSNTNFMRF